LVERATIGGGVVTPENTPSKGDEKEGPSYTRTTSHPHSIAKLSKVIVVASASVGGTGSRDKLAVDVVAAVVIWPPQVARGVWVDGDNGDNAEVRLLFVVVGLAIARDAVVSYAFAPVVNASVPVVVRLVESSPSSTSPGNDIAGRISMVHECCTR
jgi:hypothetical protein